MDKELGAMITPEPKSPITETSHPVVEFNSVLDEGIVGLQVCH